MTFLIRFSLSVAVSVFVTGAAAEISGDPQRGKQLYKKCSGCHMLGPDARNRVGPVLNNILSARAAGVSEFKYSKALTEAAREGLHWSPETLDAFLQDPKQMIPRTKMSFRGLKSAQDRKDVIAYLAAFAGGAMAAQVDEGFVVSAEILALEGDVEYGEYLSSECTTCHQASGSDDGIPSIVGWETADFATAMHAYKEKHRDHPVMQMVSNRLSDDEIAALAAYFKSLGN